MAKKTDFSSINTDRVYKQIAEATAEPVPAENDPQELPQRRKRKVYTEEEAAAIMQTMKTAGYKGVNLPRINIAFAPDVYNYVTIMAQVRGQTTTQFVNHILRLSMEENKELYNKAIEFRNSL